MANDKGSIADFVKGFVKPAFRLGTATMFLPSFVASAVRSETVMPDSYSAERERNGAFVGIGTGVAGLAADILYSSQQIADGDLTSLYVHATGAAVSVLWEATRKQRLEIAEGYKCWLGL